MKIPIFQIDAFSGKVFAGNPAAVCPLDSWLGDELMQAIAAENNLAETAFFVRAGVGYDIRWFTPATEVELCGHATLAAAHVLFTDIELGRRAVTFASKSGPLTVTKDDDLLCLDFPARPPQPVDDASLLGEFERIFSARPQEILKAVEYLAVFDDPQRVRALAPDLAGIEEVARRGKCHGIIASAADTDADFISRFFAPLAGIPEDPVTGSTHCTLVPYWAKKLGKQSLRAFQASPRGGELFCEDCGDRVLIAGRTAQYMRGEIELP